MKLRVDNWTADLRPLEKHLGRAKVGGKTSYVVTAPLSVIIGRPRWGTSYLGIVYGDGKISVWQPAGMRSSKPRIKTLLTAVAYALRQKRNVKGWKVPDYRPHAFRTKEQSAADYLATADSWERIYVTGASNKREAALWRRRIAKAREKARQMQSLGMSRDAKRVSGRRFYIEHSRHGYSAVLLDARGRSINVINGGPSDTQAKIRASAIRHWPGAREAAHPLRSKTRRKIATKRTRR